MSETEHPEPQREGESQLHPQIWVGCLAAYNNGRLHGEWIDATVGTAELAAAIDHILATSPEAGAEEWAIFDSDQFGSYRVGEYEGLERVAAVARGIREHGAAFATWAELHRDEPALLDQFEDLFIGEYDSTEAWARELLDESSLAKMLESHAVPEPLRPYLRIDYQLWARDAELGGEVEVEPAPSGGVYLFVAR